jgi:ribose-phosphate pyrophosphokinase
MKLFGLNASRAYAQLLADHLGVGLAGHEERDFADGEFKIRPLDSVRGERVFVCQSLAPDAKHSVHDKLCRLLFFAGALKDAAASDVTAVVPYLAYSRKDRRTKPRDPVATRYVARLFEAVGIDAVATIDVHNPSAFDNAFACRKEHLEATALFAEHFAPIIGDAQKIVVLAPDVGGVKRARAFAAQLSTRSTRDVELAFMEKQRSGGRVSGELFAGDVRDAVVIVFDDLIASGTTIVRAAAAAFDRGADAVHAAATHGLLLDGAVSALDGASLASLVVTDTLVDVRRRCEGLRTEVHVLKSAVLLGRALEHWNRDREIEADLPFDAD